MPSRPPSIRRVFAGGWLSDTDASIMALIWQLQRPDGSKDGHDRFEAEVIRGVDKIELLEGSSVEELKKALDERFGAPLGADGSALRNPASTPQAIQAPDSSSKA